MRLFNFFAIMFLLVGALAFSSCTDTETVTETVTEYVCADGTTATSADMCPDPEPVYDEIGPGFEVGGMECYEDGDRDGMIAGTEMGDCIKGEGGNDSIKGMGGNDSLDGGPGNDTLYGGAGDDELIGGSGNNMLHGGEGADIAVYKDAIRVVADLSKNQANVRHAMPEEVDELGFEQGDSGTGMDTLMEIENVKGSLLGVDILTGDDGDNVLKGLDQADTLNGGAGDDTLLPNRPAEVDAMGDPIANVASGTAPETDGVDNVDGGEGNDTISYEGESSGVTVALAVITPRADGDDGTPNTADDIPAHVAATVSGVADRIAIVNRGTAEEPDNESTIENVTGGFGGDTLTGDDRDNVLTGGAGGDTLNGGDGNDTLNGGVGVDTLTGGAGNDRLDGGDGNDTLNGGDGSDQFIITKGDSGDTISEFAEGDRIILKGFGGNGNVNLKIDGTLLQDVDPDDSNVTTTLVTITTGANLIRLTQDIGYVD